MKKDFILVFLCLILSIPFGLCQDHVGTVVKKQGQAEILTHPGKAISGPAPHVLYEGLYYSVQPLKLGTKVENGNILRTGKEGKVKVVFKNGDQYNVGEGTAYKIDWSTKGDQVKDASTISLMYGSIRGIIKKDGPRSGMKVKTNSAVMGVRGTDFHVGQQGSSGPSAVTVLRGKVEVAQNANPKQVIKVEQGLTAEIKTEPTSPTKATAPVSNVQLVKTTKTDLAVIHQDSKIEVKEAEKVPESVKKELAKLEEKAVETTLSDIKEYDPKMYEKLKVAKVTNVDDINQVVVAENYKKAPEKKNKADIKHIDFDNDLYNKYFKLD